MNSLSSPVPHPALSVAVWNLRHGGGSRRAGIAGAIPSLDADILVLPEWTPRGAPPMRELLESLDYSVHEPAADWPARAYGVAVATRLPARPGPLALRSKPHAMCHARVDVEHDRTVDVLAVYVPSGSGDMPLKLAVLSELTQLSSHLRDDAPVVLAGDLNCDHLDATGARDRRLVGMPEFGDLVAAGWHDAHRDVADGLAPTWWVPGHEHGFRIDHVLVRGLDTVSSEIVTERDGHTFVKQPGGETAGLSDHAALVTRLMFGGPTSAPR